MKSEHVANRRPNSSLGEKMPYSNKTSTRVFGARACYIRGSTGGRWNRGYVKESATTELTARLSQPEIH